MDASRGGEGLGGPPPPGEDVKRGCSLGLLVVLSSFLRGALPAGSAGTPGALGPVPLGLLPSEPLAPLNIQTQVHHVTFDLFTRVLRRESADGQVSQTLHEID